MPKSTIPANGGAMPAEGRLSRRLFLASGSAAAVFGALGVAKAAEPEMNAQRFIELWRSCGNVVAPLMMRGKKSFFIGGPFGDFPSIEKQWAVSNWKRATPDYVEQVFDTLVAGGSAYV